MTDKNLDALYEIARMLQLPACNDPPCVAVPRAVRDRLDLQSRALREAREALDAANANIQGNTSAEMRDPVSDRVIRRVIRQIDGALGVTAERRDQAEAH